MSPLRSLFVLVALVATAVATFAAGSTETASPSDASGSLSGDSFPVTIEHKYGTTVVPARPVRVVSVGYSEQDVLLALGVVPVGVRDWYGNQPYAVWPWAQDELGDARPQIIGSGELDLEAIVALHPDLIVGVTSGMTADEYATLSRIAPTIAQPGEYVDYGTPWDIETRLIARGVGESEKGEEIVDSINARFDRAREEHPEFVGAKAAVAFLYQGTPGAYASQDTRSRFLARLGFVTPPQYDEIAAGSFYISFSEERIDLLDVDVVVWLTTDDAGRQAVLDMPLRQRLNIAKEKREIFAGTLLGGALSFSSPLSLEYALDVMVPELAAAVDGDPNTLVTEEYR